MYKLLCHTEAGVIQRVHSERTTLWRKKVEFELKMNK